MSIIRIGFTGTRDGMTAAQMVAVHDYLAYVQTVNDWDDIERYEWHHGDCMGSDAQSHVIATVLRCWTVAHPPVNARWRAWCKASEIREPKAYLPRDWDIAEEPRELVATPKDFSPQSRLSGTWTTIGYAVQLGRPAQVCLPDGTWRAGSTFFGALLPALVTGGPS